MLTVLLLTAIFGWLFKKWQYSRNYNVKKRKLNKKNDLDK